MAISLQSSKNRIAISWGHKIQPHLILRRLCSSVLKYFRYEVGLNSIKVFYYSRYSKQSYPIVLLRLTSIVKRCLLGRLSQFIQSNLVKYSKLFVELFKMIPSKKCFYWRYQPHNYYCFVCKSLTSLVQRIFILETNVFSKQTCHGGDWTQG